MVTEAQYRQLKEQNYSDEEIEEAELQSSYNRSQQQQDPRQFSSHTLVSGGMPTDILQWQLELDSILERVEHLLRGDKPTFRDGSVIYIAPKDIKDRILNEHGISEVMRLLSLYVNRNTVLSNYDEPTINYKVFDFGCDLADLFFLKYDEFGMDTPQKRKLYPILVREMIDIVHSSYLRALNGGERESLRKMMSISQQIMNPEQMGQQGMGMSRERSLINPMRYIKGRYK